MSFSVQLTEYEACGRCGHTWPAGGKQSNLQVALNDLARAMTISSVSRFVGVPQPPMTLREKMLLTASLLRVRAVVSGWRERGLLMGHWVIDGHHGSARRNLSEDFGIAMAVSYLSKVCSCDWHFSLEVGKNKHRFGISSGKRPDIGSVTDTGRRVLTEAKGRMNLCELKPRPGRVEPAELVRRSYRQVTSDGEALLPASTRLFVCVASPVAAGRAVQLDAAEYVTGPAEGCKQCDSVDLPDDEDTRRLVRVLETDWDALQSGWYQRFAMLVGGTDASLDETGQYHVHTLADADVTIGLHRRITELTSNPDERPGPRLSETLDDLAEQIDVDNGRYPDGTLVRVNWPEAESP